MFLGRSTVQWTALITGVISAIQTIIAATQPPDVAAQWAVILGAIGTVLGVVIAFLANTQTTPIADPQLKVGTIIRATDASGTIIGHVPVPEPAAPPVVQPDGNG